MPTQPRTVCQENAINVNKAGVTASFKAESGLKPDKNSIHFQNAKIAKPIVIALSEPIIIFFKFPFASDAAALASTSNRNKAKPTYKATAFCLNIKNLHMHSLNSADEGFGLKKITI